MFRKEVSPLYNRAVIIDQELGVILNGVFSVDEPEAHGATVCLPLDSVIQSTIRCSLHVYYTLCRSRHKTIARIFAKPNCWIKLKWILPCFPHWVDISVRLDYLLVQRRQSIGWHFKLDYFLQHMRVKLTKEMPGLPVFSWTWNTPLDQVVQSSVFNSLAENFLNFSCRVDVYRSWRATVTIIHCTKRQIKSKWTWKPMLITPKTSWKTESIK